jgi:hypothetical protein
LPADWQLNHYPSASFWIVLKIDLAWRSTGARPFGALLYRFKLKRFVRVEKHCYIEVPCRREGILTMIRIKENRKIVCAAALFLGLLLMAACATAAQQASHAGAKIEVARISPQDAYSQVAAGKALLVCAYENEESCSTIMLEGGLSLKDFESKLAGLKKDQFIIFYCA